MKKNNKKGFTIVELVIVIAVIGILAAVLIPTFGNIISDANDKAALQNARNIYTEYLVFAGGQPEDEAAYISGDAVYIVTEVSGAKYYFSVTNGEIDDMTSTEAKGKTFIKAVGTSVTTEAGPTT